MILDPNIQLSKRKLLHLFYVFKKFQDDVFNKHFPLRVDYKNAKEILQKDCQNLISKQFIGIWQTIS